MVSRDYILFHKHPLLIDSNKYKIIEICDLERDVFFSHKDSIASGLWRNVYLILEFCHVQLSYNGQGRVNYIFLHGIYLHKNGVHRLWKIKDLIEPASFTELSLFKF